LGYIGHSSDGKVTVDAGSLLASEIGILGHHSIATGRATVTGAGSMWTNSGQLNVGEKGHGTLTIEDGGQVSNNYAYLADFQYSTGVATVTGLGSMWTNTGKLQIGNHGHGTLTLEAGGQVSNTFGSLGIYSGSTGTAIVAGVGSKWTNGNGLTVGDSGNGTLTIQDGGQVSSTTGYLGYSARSTGTVTVIGAGSKWTNSGVRGSGQLYVGRAGNGTLTVKAGGVVSSGSGYVGYLSGSMGTAIVTGENSKWINSGELEVGKTGSLTVSDGGEVMAALLFASLGNLLGNGTISVTSGGVMDADLVFDAAHGNVASLNFGSGGTLTVQAGGGNLGVGLRQSGSLTICDGVNISSGFGYLGDNSGSSGTATVAGEGSKWTNSRYLYVGYQGHGSLTIENGGQVSNTIGYLGNSSGSSGTVTVTGAGSMWTNSGQLYVGNQGHGTLAIEDGGQVSNTTGSLGSSDSAGSIGTVTVTGAGSTWINSGNLIVGNYGGGTLTINDGALVNVGGTLRVDYRSPGDSVINMATGGMLALKGNADDSLSQFLTLVQGTDAIRYWNASLSDWAPLTTAIYGDDYTLQYLTEGDLAGYTLLTVGTAIPEPSCLALIAGLMLVVYTPSRSINCILKAQ
jgi:T5SS/PEP-CTERM-associated repeat protein